MAKPRTKPYCTVCRCPLTLLAGDTRIMCLRCAEQRRVIPITRKPRPPEARQQTVVEQADEWFQRAMAGALSQRKNLSPHAKGDEE